MRMAAVFTLTTVTIARRAQIVSRWLTAAGIAAALVLLIGVGISAWVELLFPAWILALSVDILTADCKLPRAARGNGTPELINRRTDPVVRPEVHTVRPCKTGMGSRDCASADRPDLHPSRAAPSGASRPHRSADTDRQAACKYATERYVRAGCGDGAIAPALSVIVRGAILMTVRRACQTERGAEPGCLAQPAHHGLHQLVVGFYGGRSTAHGRAPAGEPDLQSTLPWARSQAADVPAAVTVSWG